MSAYTGWAPQEFNEDAMDATTDAHNGDAAAAQPQESQAGVSNPTDSGEFQYDSTSGDAQITASGGPGCIVCS